MKGRLGTALLLLIVFGAGLGMLYGGVHLVQVQTSGTPARATVTECHNGGFRNRTDVCTGTWVAGGSLLDNGRVVLGTIEGASDDDVGKTLDVRLSGDTAYTRSYRVAVILLAIGGAVTGFGLWLAWKLVTTGRRREAAPAAAA